MNSEYILTKEQIREINKRYGGNLRSDTEVETALHRARGKNVYRKIACLWRAILAGHLFTDANKRTALMVSLTILEKCQIKLTPEGKKILVSAIKKIARENITDVDKIERLVRYAATGH